MRFAPLLLALAPLPAIAAPAVEEVSLSDLSASLASGRVTSLGITQAYLARIATLDRKGPKLRAIIAINPEALAAAFGCSAQGGEGARAA